MSASDFLGLGNLQEKYQKCSELENEFVVVKSEIEIIKCKNKSLQEEAEEIEQNIF